MSTPPEPSDPSPEKPAENLSMGGILASIRQVLADDQQAGHTAQAHAVKADAPKVPASQPAHEATSKDTPEDVFVLEASMMVPSTVSGGEAPPVEPLLAPETAAAAASSMGELVRRVTVERSTQVARGGPTLEDLVREEIRPVLKTWLDNNLPPLVEKLVKREIERVVGRLTDDL